MTSQPVNHRMQPRPEAATSRARRNAILGVAEWRELLHEEELRCARTGFRSGIISIDHGPTGEAFEDDAGARSELVVETILPSLAFTDRAAMLGAGSVGVLAMPVRSIFDLKRRATEIDRALKAVGISAAVGFAMRRNDGWGLLGAAARADACSAAAHARHIRLGA